MNRAAGYELYNGIMISDISKFLSSLGEDTLGFGKDILGGGIEPARFVLCAGLAYR